MPIAAFLTCIFIGWIIGPNIVINEAAGLSGFKYKKRYLAMTYYIAPILVLLILLTSVLVSLKILTI